MPLQNLNHYLVVTHDLEATRAFYVDVLGLTIGDRPPFSFPGLWLYIGDRAVVHVAVRDERRGHGAGAAGTDTPTGAVDHIAFEATGHGEMTARLQARDIAARQRTVPDLGLRQIFVTDPNGVKIELNYPASES